MDLSTKTVFVSRNVHFHENIFPFATDVKDFFDPFLLKLMLLLLVLIWKLLLLLLASQILNLILLVLVIP